MIHASGWFSVRRSWSGAERKLALIGIEALPAVRPEPLERAEAGLVGHALRILDPIAEIDVGQARPRGADDMIEDDVGAEARARRLVGLEEAVDHRQAVALLVGEAGADKAAGAAALPRLAIFDDIG